MATVSVRYIVHDVDAAIAFYCDDLDFTEVMHPAPAFAMLSRGDLRLVLSAPGGGPGGGQAMPDGAVPEPGGWNRFSIEVADLAATVSELRRKGVRFRNEIVTGVGGKQILAVDPSGNLVELFEPVLPEAQLSQPSLARALGQVMAGSRTLASSRALAVLDAISTQLHHTDHPDRSRCDARRHAGLARPHRRARSPLPVRRRASPETRRHGGPCVARTRSLRPPGQSHHRPV